MSELNCCTFSSTGDRNKLQYYKHCNTCHPDDADKHVCLNCLAICHDGHDMGPLTLGSVHCDCGEGGKCKSLRSQETTQKSQTQTSGKRGRTAKEAPAPVETFTVNDKSYASLFQSTTSLLSSNLSGGLSTTSAIVDNDDDAMVIFSTQPYNLPPAVDEQAKKKPKVSKKAAAKKDTAASDSAAASTGAASSSSTSSDAAAASSTPAEVAAPVVKTKAPKVKPEKPIRMGAKPKKDKDAPKGPQASYMIFSNATREATKAETVGLTMVEVSRLIGQKWSKMSLAEKAPYEDAAREDRDRYALEMHDYRVRKEKAIAARAAAVMEKVAAATV